LTEPYSTSVHVENDKASSVVKWEAAIDTLKTDATKKEYKRYNKKF
jgi:hypothetical protein